MADGWANNLKKVGDVYHCRIRHKGQEIHRSTGKRTPEGARKWLRALLNAMDGKREGDAPAPTVGELVAFWKEDNAETFSELHIQRAMFDFEKYLLPKFAKVPADQVTSAHITEIRRQLLASSGPSGRRHSKATANLLLRHLRALWNYALAEGLISEVTWAVEKQRIQKKPKVVLPEELIEPFLAHVRESRNPEVIICVMAMLYMGHRESEALQMRWDLFAPDGSTYTPGKWDEDQDDLKSKGGEAVAIDVPPELWGLIQDLAESRKAMPLCPWVLAFQDDEGQWRPHWAHFATYAIKRAGRLVGLPKLSPHRLRGSCATLLARQGVDAFVIQDILRHKDLETTRGYIEVGRKDRRQALEGLWHRKQG